MNTRKLLLSILFPLATLLGFTGCGRSATSLSATPPAGGQASHGEHDHAPAREFADELAELSPEDRAAAERQKTCPVTDEPLGCMGVPPKITVSGRQVFICCEGCEEALKKGPGEVPCEAARMTARA